jgi:hypothetical protein
MPRTDPAAPRILAVLTVRNEGVFLIDWLAHHRAAGVTDFLVLSNDCDDGTDRMLDRLQDMGWIIHLHNPGPHPRGPQWAALKRAEAHPLRRGADWVMVLDIDEFVNVHTGDHSVGALLASRPDATAFALSWRLFGNAGLVRQPPAAVPDTFHLAAPAAMRWPWRAAQIKTLFRNDGTYARLGVHRPRQPDPARLGAQRWFDGGGSPLSGAILERGVFLPPGQDRYGLAQVNHYALGAMEDFLVKCDRGRANRDAAPLDMAYWIERNFCAIEDRSIEALGPQRRAMADALRSDLALARLEALARDWRRARVRTLLTDEAWRAQVVRMLMAGPTQPLDRTATDLVTALFANAIQTQVVDKTEPNTTSD